MPGVIANTTNPFYTPKIAVDRGSFNRSNKYSYNSVFYLDLSLKKILFFPFLFSELEFKRAWYLPLQCPESCKSVARLGIWHTSARVKFELRNVSLPLEIYLL